jgi:hypothetical protein
MSAATVAVTESAETAGATPARSVHRVLRDGDRPGLRQERRSSADPLPRNPSRDGGGEARDPSAGVAVRSPTAGPGAAPAAVRAPGIAPQAALVARHSAGGGPHGGRPRTASPPRLRRLPVPAREPMPARRVRDGEGQRIPSTQGTLALAVPLSQAIRAAFDPPPGTESVPPEHWEWALTFAQATTEVEAGLRSPGQLIRWTSLDVQARLTRRGALAARARRAGPGKGAKPHIRSLRMSAPREGVYEASAVIGEQDRARAIAFRMEDVDGRWRVTELEIG